MSIAECPPAYYDSSVPRDERIASLGYDYAAQPKEFVSTCNLCGERAWHVVTQEDRCGYPAQATACRKCGLVLLNPRMTREAYAEFYAGWYRKIVSAHTGREINAESLDESQRHYAGQLAEFVAQHIQPSYKTLIDVGGSCGVLAAKFAERFGLTPTVLDPSPDELERAAANGCETIAGFLEDFDTNRKFDVVAMVQTADHLLDLQGSLRRVRRLLSLDGVLLVDIVDFDHMLTQFGIQQAIKIDHPYSLTDPVFVACLRRCGFSLVKRGKTGDQRHIIYVCKKATPIEDAMPPREYVDNLFQKLGITL